MQAGFAEGKSSIIKFNQETKINNVCESGGYGSNRVSASSKSNVGDKWLNAGAETIIKNKYLFTSLDSSKNYIVFSKQLSIGFKVADLIFLTSNNYCFINPPSEIEDEIRVFQIPNFKLNSQNCANSSINVCFSSAKTRQERTKQKCNMTVRGTCTGCNSEYEQGYIEKQNKRYFYTGSLMYGAIVSDYNLYTCNVQRLLYRLSGITGLYIKKGDMMSSRQCYTNLKPELELFKNATEIASKSGRFDSAFSSIASAAKELDKKNSQEVCEIW
jgi:hypothetical protein